jgi:hypothetical protein
MNLRAICEPTLRFDCNPSAGGYGIVSVCGLGRDVLALCLQVGDFLKLMFRVIVAERPSPDGLPNVAGRYLLSGDELQFIPHFPFERGLKYRASFDLRQLGDSLTPEPLTLDFAIPAEESPPGLTAVTSVFPSSDLLPENLLRFYVCFSNRMQRGHALKEISLLDSLGQQVDDALYRPPVELWDRTMRHLTVLLDPGRLKRWVGPNRELGPPLRVGEQYTLEIGSGMVDQHGPPLRKPFRKRFLVGDPVRKHISIEHWKILPPAKGSQEALVLLFPDPLDWALLFHTIRVRPVEGAVMQGQVAIDRCERRWSFTPHSPWIPGPYQIRIDSSLEDVCGNSITGAFDRPLRKGPNLATEINTFSLRFNLI